MKITTKMLCILFHTLFIIKNFILNITYIRMYQNETFHTNPKQAHKKQSAFIQQHKAH